MSRSPSAKSSKISSRYSRSSQSTHSSLHLDTVLFSSHASPRRENFPDSGYESPRGSTSKLSLHEAYQQWKAADEAARALNDLRRSINACAARLKAAKERLQQLEAQREPLKRKKSFLTGILGRSKQSVSQVADPSSDGLALSLTNAKSTAEESQWALAQLKNQLDQKTYQSAKLDESYALLKYCLEHGPLPSWRFEVGNEEEISRVEKTTAKVEAAFADSESMTEAFRFAQQAIQSAHHHYDKAMYLLEGVCGSGRGKLVAIMADEESKQATYKEAASWSEKAQMCFNECLKRLDAHDQTLQSDVAQDLEELKQVGLLQAVQLYNLNYGGKALQFGIATQMQIMLQKQEAIFQRLTTFAIWVQNFTAQAESMHQEMREKRDAARRKLVALWMNEHSDVASVLSSPRSRASVL